MSRVYASLCDEILKESRQKHREYPRQSISRIALNIVNERKYNEETSNELRKLIVNKLGI